jgi:hypothetical protein
MLSLSVALLIASSGFVFATESPPDKAAVNALTMPAIEFYLAKGEADACGPGCNVWIAAEGRIDAGAPQRLRRLLAKLGRLRPPIYFHSPGGSVEGSLEIGRLLHEQKLEVSVAHTVPRDCEHGTPEEKSCEARKRAGEAIEAQFDPLRAMCNSGCVYVLAGGTVRHVPPWVKLGVHDVGLDPRVAPPRAIAREAKEINREHIEQYLREMRIDDGLFKAAFAVPFESKRFLEREEVVRFGIDRSEFAETPWQLIEKPTPMLIKSYFARTDDERVKYLDGLVSLNCSLGQAFRLVLLREHAVTDLSAARSRPVSVDVNGQRFELIDQGASQQLDTHSTSLARSAVEAVGDDSKLRLSASDLARNDESRGGLMLSMHGFPAAYAKFRTSCDAAARNAANAWLRDANDAYLAPKSGPSVDAFSVGRLPLPKLPATLTPPTANPAKSAP